MGLKFGEVGNICSIYFIHKVKVPFPVLLELSIKLYMLTILVLKHIVCKVSDIWVSDRPEFLFISSILFWECNECNRDIIGSYILNVSWRYRLGESFCNGRRFLTIFLVPIS